MRNLYICIYSAKCRTLMRALANRMEASAPIYADKLCSKRFELVYIQRRFAFICQPRAVFVFQALQNVSTTTHRYSFWGGPNSGSAHYAVHKYFIQIIPTQYSAAIRLHKPFEITIHTHTHDRCCRAGSYNYKGSQYQVQRTRFRIEMECKCIVIN